MQRTGQMPPEEVFSRLLFGLVLVGSCFFSWGRWVAGVLGLLFVISALSGFCLTCWLYKKFFSK